MITVMNTLLSLFSLIGLILILVVGVLIHYEETGVIMA